MFPQLDLTFRTFPELPEGGGADLGGLGVSLGLSDGLGFDAEEVGATAYEEFS